MKRLCDSNYGEQITSFAPLVAWEDENGRIIIENTAFTHGFLGESYDNILEAANHRGFIRRWLADQR